MVRQAATFLDVSFATANGLVGALERLGYLRKATDGARNRVSLCQSCLDVVSDP